MIKRDGYLKSLWQGTSSPYLTKNLADAHKQYDVIIIGGGITGVSTALLLQEVGKKCLLIEAQTLCFGTTSGTTAHLNTLLDTDYATIEKNFDEETAREVAHAADEAIALIYSNASKYGLDCELEEASAMVYATTKEQDRQLNELKKAARKVGLVVNDEQNVPSTFSSTSAVRVEGQAKFNPIKYVHGIARAFEDHGGHILEECRVTNVKPGKPIEVETTKGNFVATNIVYATHIPPGVNLIHLRCAPWRTYVMAATLADDAYPSQLIYDLEDPYNYFRTHVIAGKSYLIAGGKDHKTGIEENTGHCLTALEAVVRSRFKVKDIVYHWSSQYFEPADGLPYIGHLPGHPHNIYVATGFGGNGMVYSSVAAITISHLMLGIEDKKISIFNPNRIKPVAGFTNFISQNAGVVKNLASRLLPADKIKQLADLAVGEGRIVKFEHETIGIYKDEKGIVHAVDPVCTHLKCEVKWNAAEKSWDCPCHGARFDCDGKVLTGPADHSLEIVKLSDLLQKSS